MDLRQFNTAFCDSGDALKSATEEGLPADCRVLTASPFLQAALGSRAEFLRNRLTRRTIADIEAIRPELQRRALKIARATPETHDYAEVAALMFLNSLDQLILAACLTPADCEEPRLIIRAETGNAQADQAFNGPWDVLLGGNNSAVVKIFKVVVDGFDPTSWGAPRGLLDRIRVASWRRAVFRMISSLGRLWPAFSGKEALLLSENELLQETAFSLALRGWSLRSVRIASAPAELDSVETGALRALCAEAFAPYVERWVVPPLRARLVDLIGDRLLTAARHQKGAANQFERLVAALPPRERRVVLSNYPANASSLGAWHVARARGIPLFGFQHSVSCEICEAHDATFSTYEVVCSDRAYSFNERAAAIANAIPDRQGLSVPVGMPGDFRGIKNGGLFRKRLAPIAFVSTAVYSGYWNRLWYGTRTDTGMLAFELLMLKDVFAGLRHDVLYKRYPALRLLDADPAAAVARSIPNIEVYWDYVDLRYLLAGCDVLVTARATSTLSWCVMSDKPVVFVDIDDDMRLREDVRPAFEKGLFLFSTAQRGWEAKLHAFLDRPIADIRQEWQAKAADRREMVRRYFDMGGSAGARAASDIASFTSHASALVPAQQFAARGR